MDKLEPLIRNRFWVLFGLSLLFALGGYFFASGMKADTEAREQSLESTINGVPKGDVEPNADYAAKLTVINGGLQSENDVEVQKLWEAQRSRMHWPTILVKKGYLPNEFRGEIAQSARRYYTEVYPDIMKRVWERAEPVVNNPPPPGLDVDWDQKVLLMPETIPRQYFHRNQTPSNKQIWDAQEDVWLLELIFDGIVRTNRDAGWIGEAPVRRIDRLELTGGSGVSSVMVDDSMGLEDGLGGLGFEEEEYEQDLSGAGSSQMSGLGGMLGGGMRGGITAGGREVAFNVEEEFGPPISESTEDDFMEEGEDGYGEFDEFGGFGGDMGGGAMGMMMGAFGDPGMMSGMSGGASGLYGGGDLFRYIGEPSAVENDPFRERGFYMSVIIMLPEIPDFFAEMSSSDWPIRIGRFQIGPNPYAIDDSGSSQPMGGFAGSSGFGGLGMDEYDEDVFGGGGSGLGSYGGGRGGMGGRGAGAMMSMGSEMGLAGMMGSMSGGMMGSMSGGFGRTQGYGAGSLPLPMSMQGPSEIDPNWFAHPDLVQVDFCGIITMYNPVTDDELVPTSDGSSVEETEEALAEQEAALETAAQEAANQPAITVPATDTVPPAGDVDPEADNSVEQVPVDGGEVSPAEANP